MLRKTMICAAAAALLGVTGVSFAQTVVTESTRVARDNDGIVNKKVIHHPNGNKTVVKKKVKYDAYGNRVVKKKVVRHASAKPTHVTVVRRAPAKAVVVHRTVPTTTTVIRRVD